MDRHVLTTKREVIISTPNLVLLLVSCPSNASLVYLGVQKQRTVLDSSLPLTHHIQFVPCPIISTSSHVSLQSVAVPPALLLNLVRVFFSFTPTIITAPWLGPLPQPWPVHHLIYTPPRPVLRHLADGLLLLYFTVLSFFPVLYYHHSSWHPAWGVHIWP